MIKSLNPNLSFDGTCEAAFEFYKSAFGGEFAVLVRYKDAPPVPGREIPDLDKEKIMHVRLRLTEHNFLMGCDACPQSAPPPQSGGSVELTLNLDSDAETCRLYEALSAGGTIRTPLRKAFWASLCGSFDDKFGIRWVLISDAPNA